MNNLNRQYFKTRKKHRNEAKKKKKLTLKQALLNLFIAAIIIVIYTLLQKHLNKKIEINKKNVLKIEKTNFKSTIDNSLFHF